LNNFVQIAGHGLEASWAGGIKGREVMDRFFPYVPELLSDHGMFYLVTVKENDIGITMYVIYSMYILHFIRLFFITFGYSNYLYQLLFFRNSTTLLKPLLTEFTVGISTRFSGCLNNTAVPLNSKHGNQLP